MGLLKALTEGGPTSSGGKLAQRLIGGGSYSSQDGETVVHRCMAVERKVTGTLRMHFHIGHLPVRSKSGIFLSWVDSND